MKHWYAITTKKNFEFFARDQLIAKGYEAYLPLTWKDKRLLTNSATVKTIQKPIALFQGYLFVNIDEGIEDFGPIYTARDVTGIVKLGRDEGGYHVPTVVDNAVIDALKLLENEQGIHMTKCDYSLGDGVRIKNGIWYGELSKIVELKPNGRLFGLINIMNREVKIELERHNIEAV